jgi:uncharacterized membrane protein HdeD (DUF308 family)
MCPASDLTGLRLKRTPDPLISSNEHDSDGWPMSMSQAGVALREHWLAYLIEGILLVVLGAAAILVPNWATLTVTIFLGWIFLVSGIAGLITTFWLRRAPGFWWSLLSAVLAIVIGALLIGWPVGGAISLTLALLVYFAMEGIFSIMFGLEHQRSLSGRWGWLVLNGVIDLFLVGVILVGLPNIAAWVLGLLVGIDLVYGGSALMALSLTARTKNPA